MARIPVYGGPQVEQQALRTVEQRPIDVSSGTRALGQAIGAVADLGDKIVRRDAEIEVNDIDAKLTAGWLEWDAQARRQYQGQNVGEYEVKAREWWDKARGEYTGKASPLAQRALGQVMLRKQTQALGSVLGHVNTEKERFADQQAEAAAQNTIELGIDSNDPAGAAARVRSIAAEKGQRKGWDTDMIQAEQQRLLGTLHLSYITRLVDTNQVDRAVQYASDKNVAAEIPATAQVKVEELLRNAKNDQEASRFAMKHANLPLSEQLAKAAELPADVREKADVYIRQNHAVVRAAQQEREQAASDEAWQMVGQGRRVPESTLMRMNGRERVQLQDYLKERSKKAAEGTPVKTNPAEMGRLLDMARDNPDEFKKLRMEPLSLKLAQSDLEQIAALQRRMLKPETEKDALTVVQQIGSYARPMKPKQRQQFESAALAEVVKFQAENNRAPNQAERTELFDALAVKAVLEDDFLWFDLEKPVYQLTPEERTRARIPAPIPGATPAPAAAPVRVKTVEEARKLAPGTRFIDPQGVERIR